MSLQRPAENMMRLFRDSLLLPRISAEISREDYKSAIALAESRVKVSEPATLANREIKYLLGVAYDYDGRHMEAFAIFKELAERFPAFPTYTVSLLRCGDVIVRRMYQHYTSEAKPEPVELMRSIQWLEENHYVPIPLQKMAIVTLIEMGKVADAKQRALNAFELYPNDLMILELNREIAMQLQDNDWNELITSRVRAILERHPWRIDLYQLLPIETQAANQ
ncbi:MAG: hypothetical protein IT288_09280 [Bdellovibrionales bacterium]|nr:hypothetical protein [Bdellovibrionales bacterium]